MWALAIGFLLAAWFWDFWPFTGGNFRPIEYRHDYHVYFYFPEDRQSAVPRERYLGKVTGLDGCGATASSFAAQNQVHGARWGYVCCSIRKGSQCYEKER